MDNLSMMVNQSIYVSLYLPISLPFYELYGRWGKEGDGEELTFIFSLRIVIENPERE